MKSWLISLLSLFNASVCKVSLDIKIEPHIKFKEQATDGKLNLIGKLLLIVYLFV